MTTLKITQIEHKPMWTCPEIVEMLDRYIIGQGDAKKSVAIALRNRWRRMQLPVEMRREVFFELIDVLGAPFTVDDSRQHPIKPARTFTAGRTLPAGLGKIKSRDAL